MSKFYNTKYQTLQCLCINNLKYVLTVSINDFYDDQGGLKAYEERFLEVYDEDDELISSEVKYRELKTLDEINERIDDLKYITNEEVMQLILVMAERER